MERILVYISVFLFCARDDKSVENSLSNSSSTNETGRKLSIMEVMKNKQEQQQQKQQKAMSYTQSFAAR